MAENNNRPTGEFGLIHWIQEQIEESGSLVLGIGDDCAIEELQEGRQLLTSTDLLIEDIHFRRSWTSMFKLGRKSVAVNLSDIAAMGGIPHSLYLGIGRSAQIDDADIKDFIRGFLDEAGRCNVVLAGGDTCGSPGPLMIAVTVHGSVLKNEALRRHGAKIGDGIYVSGQLGDSALALHQLQGGVSPAATLAARLHTPTARITLGQQLAKQRLATAMIDISDGVLADLNHLLVASGVGAELELKQLPLSDCFRQVLKHEPQLIELALAGGEDYELLFTSPALALATRDDLQPGVTRIGTICQQPGIQIIQADGSIYCCQRQGFDHFLSA